MASSLLSLTFLQKLVKIPALLLLCALFFNNCQSHLAEIAPEKFAPSITLPLFFDPQNPSDDHNNQKQKNLSLADFKGKIVILTFFASWCEGCREELPSLVKLKKNLPNKLEVLAIAIDDEENSLKKLLQESGANFPVLLDNKGISRKTFGLSGVPESFVIGADGKFKMLFDYQNNEPALRLIGPRDWTHPAFAKQIGAL
ncbi:MAG TPA: TlpA disulfide reductase family protein [Oligoflexia bacterium]|nr:TlpA disulfide reductase family protein [Oligoflexia bacterium]HMP27638.1 TlpA disulfide reductase family protein [Oligoflexia bacterium]